MAFNLYMNGAFIIIQQGGVDVMREPREHTQFK